jgi:protein-disulfide reductase (glutathione)
MLPPTRRPAWLRSRVPWAWLLALTSCVEEADPPGTRSKAAAKPTPPPVVEAQPVGNAPSNGFNDAIAWRTLDDGLAALASGRPMMLVVHASWCHRCKELRPAFSDAEVAELSQHFTMVNVDQDLVPAAQTYAPDGTYIPRVLFFDPGTRDVDTAILNARRDRFRYFYGPHDDVEGAMRQALERHDHT